MRSQLIKASGGVLLLGSLMLSACEVKDPMDGVNLKINFNPAPTMVSATIVDAQTGAPLEKKGIVVSVEGTASPRVVDGAGESMTRFTIDQGFISFGLKGTTPTPEAPVQLLLVVEAPGYLKTSSEVVVDSDKPSPITIGMVNLAKPPEGTTVAADKPVSSSSTGAVTTTTTVTTPVESNTGTTATLTLPQGVVAKDAKGQALTGQLKTTVVYFNNQDTASLRSFPGGFDVQVSGAATNDGAFVTGGFVAAELKDASGKQASTFSKPVELSIEVPKGTVHPETGRAVKAGDTIPYWSFEPENGRWAFEGNVVLKENAKGNFTATFAASHFSYYNLDWFRSANCRQAKINITGKPKGMSVPIELFNMRTNQFFKRVAQSDETGVLHLFNAPRDMPMRLVAKHPQTGAVIGRVEIANLCAGGTLAINVPAPTVPMVTVTADAKGICPNGIEVRPDVPLYYRNVTKNTNFVFATNMVKGKASMQVETGQTYEFKGSVTLKDGLKTGTQLFKAGTDNPAIVITVNLPSSSC